MAIPVTSRGPVLPPSPEARFDRWASRRRSQVETMIALIHNLTIRVFYSAEAEMVFRGVILCVRTKQRNSVSPPDIGDSARLLPFSILGPTMT
jgi:hypothetical protein